MYTNLAVCKGKYTINIGKFLKGMANTAPVLVRGCVALHLYFGNRDKFQIQVFNQRLDLRSFKNFPPRFHCRF